MKNILLVEDEQSLSTSLADLLTQEGMFSVLTASNGWEALKLLKTKPVHLIVTDLRMPQMDGFELLANVFAIKPVPPVVVVSAFATPIIRKKLMEIGVVEVLDKPIDLELLVAAINAGLQRGSFGDRVGFPLGSFIQAMEAEQKTALLDVIDGHGKRGFLFLDEGVLTDAILGNLEGEAAARRMLLWPRAIIRFRDVPEGKIRPNIQSDAATLLAQSLNPPKAASAAPRPGQQETPAPAQPAPPKPAPLPARPQGMALDGVFGFILGPEDITPQYELSIPVSADATEALSSGITAGARPGLASNGREPQKQTPVKGAATEPRKVEPIPPSREQARAGRTVEGPRLSPDLVKKIFGNEDPQTAKAREMLREMAQKLEYVRACIVISRDGSLSAAYGPSMAKDNGLGAGFSSVMDMLSKSIKDLDFGAIEENLLQTEKTWVVARFLGARYCLVIAVGRLCSLGDVRMVIKQYSEKLLASLP